MSSLGDVESRARQGAVISSQRMRFVGVLLAAARVAADSSFDLAKLQWKNESVAIDYTYDGERISPWHDVPFSLGTDALTGQMLLSFVCEIPRHTREKMEIHK